MESLVSILLCHNETFLASWHLASCSGGEGGEGDGGYKLAMYREQNKNAGSGEGRGERAKFYRVQLELYYRVQSQSSIMFNLSCNAKEPLYILLKLARQLAHTYQLGMFPTVCLLHMHTLNSKIATLYPRSSSKMFVAAYVADFTQRGGPVHRKAAWERLMTSLYSYLSPHTTHIDHI